MPIALSISETHDYVLECDRSNPVEEQTVFLIGQLDLGERIRIEDGQADYQFSASKTSDARADLKINRHARNYQVIRHALRGWRNFRDKDGNEIEFETIAEPTSSRRGTVNVASDRCLKRLSLEWVDELADVIINGSRLTETERKN